MTVTDTEDSQSPQECKMLVRTEEYSVGEDGSLYSGVKFIPPMNAVYDLALRLNRANSLLKDILETNYDYSDSGWKSITDSIENVLGEININADV